MLSLQDFFTQEMDLYLRVSEARKKQLGRLDTDSRARLAAMRQKDIDRVIHPDKYARPKGRPAPGGGAKEGGGRYRPSEAAQARRTIKQKGG